MIKYLVFIFFIPTTIFGQGCNYENSSNDIEKLCNFLGRSFSTNTDAENALDKILSVSGMSQKFVIGRCDQIDNCCAIINNQGIRYILYNYSFMQGILNKTNYWSNFSVLAHEVGHHVNGHTIRNPSSLKESRDWELEADEFSGFTMQKLGSSLSQAQAAVREVSSNRDDTYSSHPSLNKRLEAIKRGYNKATGQSLPSVTITNTNLTDEDYFYKAINAPEEAHNYKIENFTKCISYNGKHKPICFLYGAEEKRITKDYIGALNDYQTAQNLFKDEEGVQVFIHLALGEIKMDLEDYSGAINHFNYIIIKHIEDDGIQYANWTQLAYMNRGYIKYKTSLPYCSDYKKACALGNKEACEIYDKMFCR
ncbi:MAG: M48 family metalloprotease [Flavobacteriales bacterium]|nr:M48 family metalloprotease [Flavobacteriales bacterium]